MRRLLARRHVLALGVASFLCLPASANVVLYDGSLGTIPQGQNWQFQADGGSIVTPPASVSAVWSAGATTLDTLSPLTDRAGFARGPLANPLPSALDRVAGYTITFDVQIEAENHTSNDRSGFSVIALSSDQSGIELAFWSDRVWAQMDSPIFTHGEEVLFATTSMTRYTLQVLGGSYALSAPGMPTLNGALRNYSSFGLPYNLGNFLFLGDNTTSGEARMRLAYVALAPIPEPACLAGVIAAALVTLRRRS